MIPVLLILGFSAAAGALFVDAFDGGAETDPDSQEGSMPDAEPPMDTVSIGDLLDPTAETASPEEEPAPDWAEADSAPLRYGNRSCPGCRGNWGRTLQYCRIGRSGH